MSDHGTSHGDSSDVTGCIAQLGELGIEVTCCEGRDDGSPVVVQTLATECECRRRVRVGGNVPGHDGLRSRCDGCVHVSTSRGSRPSRLVVQVLWNCHWKPLPVRTAHEGPSTAWGTLITRGTGVYSPWPVEGPCDAQHRWAGIVVLVALLSRWPFRPIGTRKRAHHGYCRRIVLVQLRRDHREQ